jgi:dihydropteroate synthase
MSNLSWQLRDRLLDLDQQPLIMGIVNATPDSFSDGGKYATPDLAIGHGMRLVEEGADLLDIGGESSRPGATPVILEEELCRVIPVVRELARLTTVPLSIDTTKAEVARQALEAGAHLINDITALQGDPAMVEVVRGQQAGVLLMHMQNTPLSMQRAPAYADVFQEVRDFLEARLKALVDQGIPASRIVLDPGIGFGKTAEHNWELLARLDELGTLGRPVCLGVSRKGFLGKLLGRSVSERLAGSLACVCHALGHRPCRAAQVFRVHDVAATRDVLLVYQQLRTLEEPSTRPAKEMDH